MFPKCKISNTPTQTFLESIIILSEYLNWIAFFKLLIVLNFEKVLKLLCRCSWTSRIFFDVPYKIKMLFTLTLGMRAYFEELRVERVSFFFFKSCFLVSTNYVILRDSSDNLQKRTNTLPATKCYINILEMLFSSV